MNGNGRYLTEWESHIKQKACLASLKEAAEMNEEPLEVEKSLQLKTSTSEKNKK